MQQKCSPLLGSEQDISQVQTPPATTKETDEARCTSNNSLQSSVVELEIVGSKCNIIPAPLIPKEKGPGMLSSKDASRKGKSQATSRTPRSNKLQKQNPETLTKTKRLRQVKADHISKEKLPARGASESSDVKTTLKKSSSNLKSPSGSTTAQKKTERSSTMPSVTRSSGNLKQPQVSSTSRVQPTTTGDKLLQPNVRPPSKDKKQSLSEPKLKTSPSRKTSTASVALKDSKGRLVSRSNSSSRAESAQKKTDLTQKHSSATSVTPGRKSSNRSTASVALKDSNGSLLSRSNSSSLGESAQKKTDLTQKHSSTTSATPGRKSSNSSTASVTLKDSKGSLVRRSNSSSRAESAQKKPDLTQKHSSTTSVTLRRKASSSSTASVALKDSKGSLVSRSNSSSRAESAQNKPDLTQKHSSTTSVTLRRKASSSSTASVSLKESKGSLVSRSNSSSRAESAQKKTQLTPKHSSTTSASDNKKDSKERLDSKKTRSSTKEQMPHTSGHSRKSSPDGKSGDDIFTSDIKEEKPNCDEQTMQASGEGDNGKRPSLPQSDTDPKTEKKTCQVKEESQQSPVEPSRGKSTSRYKRSDSKSGRSSRSSENSPLNHFEVIESSNTLTFATPSYPEQRPRSCRNSTTSINKMEALNLQKETVSDLSTAISSSCDTEVSSQTSESRIKTVSSDPCCGDVKGCSQTSIQTSEEGRKSRSPKSRSRNDTEIPVQTSDEERKSRSPKSRSRTDVKIPLQTGSNKEGKSPPPKSRSRTEAEFPIKSPSPRASPNTLQSRDEARESPSHKSGSKTDVEAAIPKTNKTRKSSSAKGRSRSKTEAPMQTAEGRRYSASPKARPKSADFVVWSTSCSQTSVKRKKSASLVVKLSAGSIDASN